MIRRITLTVGALAVSLGALSAYAQGPGGGFGGGQRMGGPGAPGPMGIMAEVRRLNLTDAQKEQIRSIVEADRPPADAGATVRDTEQKLHAAVLSDAPDQGAIDSLKATLNGAHAAELDHQIALLEQVAQVLTVEQRQQLAAMPPGPGGRGRGRGRS
jgi:protein CpxP